MFIYPIFWEELKKEELPEEDKLKEDSDEDDFEIVDIPGATTI